MVTLALLFRPSTTRTDSLVCDSLLNRPPLVPFQCSQQSARWAIRAERPDSAVIVLTTYQGDEDIRKAIAAGAQAYLVKGMSHLKLLDAIRSVRAGNPYFPRGACLNDAGSEDQLAARRLILLSASEVSFLSVVFSSSSVFCSTLAQSLRPSCFAHAIRLP